MSRPADNNVLVRGMALALSEVMGQLDQPTVVGRVLRDAGLTSLKMLREAGVDEYDVKRLRSAMREARRKR